MRWAALVFCTTGCRSVLGLEPATQSVDAAIDTPAPPPDAQLCFGVDELGVAFCLVAPPADMARVESNFAIATDEVGPGLFQCRELVEPRELCVIAASTIRIPDGLTLSATGKRPLVLVADSIEIAGTLDVASHLGGTSGPATDDETGCNVGADPATEGSGGFGGSFGGRGGNGGDQAPFPGTAGVANGTFVPTTLRGGCSGSTGGQCNNCGGRGGGAVMLFANSLAVTGAINASGASGRGANPTDNGGGGGGSGGMIVLVAPEVTGSGTIFASGGAGGGGSTTTVGDAGMDPTPAMLSGSGGVGGINGGGAGAPGFPATNRNGTRGMDQGDGGGGGGGGAGVIRVFGAAGIEPTVLPPPS